MEEGVRLELTEVLPSDCLANSFPTFRPTFHLAECQRIELCRLLRHDSFQDCFSPLSYTPFGESRRIRTFSLRFKRPLHSPVMLWIHMVENDRIGLPLYRLSSDCFTIKLILHLVEEGRIARQQSRVWALPGDFSHYNRNINCRLGFTPNIVGSSL